MVRCMKNKNKTIDEYILEAKSDIYVYVLIWIIFFLILLYFAYRYDNYYLLFVDAIFLISVFNRIIIYGNLIKIKEYLTKNKLINKIGKIDYWNEKNYFLTEKYVIILKDNMVDCFEYNKIKKLRKEVVYTLKNHNNNISEYLYLVLDNECEYEFLISTTSLVAEDFYDFTSYILEKNSSVIVEESVTKINDHKL